MSRRRPLVSLALLAACCLPLTGAGQPPAGDRTPTAARLRELLEPVRKKHDLPALATAVVTRKGVVAVAAVGVRKRGEDAAVTAEDPFHLGSDTKAMTAA